MGIPKDDKIYFHPEQVKYLERVFPNTPLPNNATEIELRVRNSQQLVIQFIRDRQRPG